MNLRLVALSTLLLASVAANAQQRSTFDGFFDSSTGVFARGEVPADVMSRFDKAIKRAQLKKTSFKVQDGVCSHSAKGMATPEYLCIQVWVENDEAYKKISASLKKDIYNPFLKFESYPVFFTIGKKIFSDERSLNSYEYETGTKKWQE